MSEINQPLPEIYGADYDKHHPHKRAHPKQEAKDRSTGMLPGMEDQLDLELPDVVVEEPDKPVGRHGKIKARYIDGQSERD